MSLANVVVQQPAKFKTDLSSSRKKVQHKRLLRLKAQEIFSKKKPKRQNIRAILWQNLTDQVLVKERIVNFQKWITSEPKICVQRSYFLLFFLQPSWKMWVKGLLKL